MARKISFPDYTEEDSTNLKYCSTSPKAPPVVRTPLSETVASEDAIEEEGIRKGSESPILGIM
jgi:hypothetical protein